MWKIFFLRSIAWCHGTNQPFPGDNEKGSCVDGSVMVCCVLPSSPSATGNDAVIFAHAPHAADKTRSSSAHRTMRRRSHGGVGWYGGRGLDLLGMGFL